jgi:hypothetical protein
MLMIAEISAAPHFPQALRPAIAHNTITDFMSALSGLADIEVIEENGELRLVSHPITDD